MPKAKRVHSTQRRDAPTERMVDAYWSARQTYLEAISRLCAVEGTAKKPAIKVAEREVAKAGNKERLALEKVVGARPRSFDGVLALLAFQRELWSKDPRAMEAAHISYLCESVEDALKSHAGGGL
jgi:hypothetical protein